jgi:DNA-binding MarR family transcriptional regulator
MSQALRLKANQKKLRANEEKWGLSLVEAGWTLMPSTILEHQASFGIDPVDANILMQLARYWWRADNPPHPAIKTIAACIGKSPSTVQRRITKMKEAGLIDVEHRHDDRHHGQMSSRYRFTGLIKQATELAREALEKRAAAKSGKSKRFGGKTRSSTSLKVADGTVPVANG